MLGAAVTAAGGVSAEEMAPLHRLCGRNCASVLGLQMFLSKVFGYCMEWKNGWLSELSLIVCGWFGICQGAECLACACEALGGTEEIPPKP